jgi:putative oxidoreductase
MDSPCPFGLHFFVIGPNHLMYVVPEPQESGIAPQFIGAMNASHYVDVKGAVEIVCGVLLVSNRFVPGGLPILAPMLFIIGFFHIFMAPKFVKEVIKVRKGN